MLPQRMKKAITDNPKKLANLIDLINLPSTLREFVGQSQISRLGCFKCVWSYIKTNNLQVPRCFFVYKKMFFLLVCLSYIQFYLVTMLDFAMLLKFCKIYVKVTCNDRMI
ncbi:uncharacterized protein LOC109811320 [Cajanus cajan]|uniref:uncharacterized protein LOC109811320 n=1 Tax=Cajanus cajan TaxID=3821 RepID=UPI00098DB185|nr:uncharacterized protein LOC109811320 [Cajanus cajan]